MQPHDTPLFAMIQAMTSAMPPSCLRAGAGSHWQEKAGRGPEAGMKREA